MNTLSNGFPSVPRLAITWLKPGVNKRKQTSLKTTQLVATLLLLMCRRLQKRVDRTIALHPSLKEPNQRIHHQQLRRRSQAPALSKRPHASAEGAALSSHGRQAVVSER